MGSKAPSWADQWGNSFDREEDDKLMGKKPSMGHSSSKKMEEVKAATSAGLDKAKAAASAGAQKVKRGTSGGIKWFKKQYQKKWPSN